MAEKKIVIEKQELKYEGLFDLKKLFYMIDQWIREHGYDRYEKRNDEIVTENGKEVFLELEPWKRLSDYAKAYLKVKMNFKDLQEVEVEHDGIKETLLRGKCHFIFQARIETDYENKWESDPLYQFIRTFVDKFMHKSQTQDFEAENAADCKALREEIKAYLNLYRFQA